MNSFERTLDELKCVKLLIKNLGDTSQVELDRMKRIFSNMPSKIFFSNFYQNQLYKNTMGVFSKKDWNNDSVQIEILDQEFQYDWPELMISMKPYLLFYIIDLQEGTIPLEEIQKCKKKLNDEKLVRFLLLNCGPDSLQNIENELTFILVPQLSDDKMVYYLEDQVQLFLCQVIEYLAAEILRLKNDQSQIVLFNMKEEKINDQSKLKKRKQGRQIKIMGDFALLIGAFQDSIEYYKQALELLNKNNDYLWSGMIHQCLASAKIYPDEIEEHFREALTFLKKTKFVNLEIECFFKLMQYRIQQNDKLGLNKTIDLFTKTFDPESPMEKCKLFLFISELYGQIQMKRKQAYYLRLAANQLVQINKSMSFELTKLSNNMYGLNTYFSNVKSNVYWASLQHTLIQELQHNFSTIPNFLNLTQIQRIQMFKKDFTNTQLTSIFQSLNENSIQQELIYTNLDSIPFIEKLIITPYTEHFKKKSSEKEELKDDIFIVNPWANKENKYDLKYPLNTLINITLYLANNYFFDLKIDKILIKFEGCDCITYPISLIIPGETQHHQVKLMIQPKQIGILKITGIYIQFLNYEYVNELNQYGIPILSQCEGQPQTYNIHNIEIIEELPQVQISIYRDSTIINEVEAVYFDSSEFFTYQFLIKNNNEKTIQTLSFEIIVESEDPPIYEYKHQIQDFNLGGYATKNIFLTDTALEDGILIPKVPHTPPMIKKISLIFQISYEQSIYYKEIKINRLVVIRDRTIIQKCNFVSKYSCNNQSIKEIFDLQDSCFINLQVAKKDFLISLELQSQILIDGQFKLTLNEDNEYYSQALKLRKLAFHELCHHPDLKVLWKNLLNKTCGVLYPFQQLSKEDIFKHCCNDLIEIECKDNQKTLNYNLKIHQQLTNSQKLQITLSLTNERINTALSCSKSVIQSVQSENAIIIDGFTSFTIELKKDEQTLTSGALVYYGQLSQSNLKCVVLDKEAQRQYIKRCDIK